ncbi:hypothetical protein [Nocardia tengchongensis]|uniref:hypothetical protein n=1 Tax=Nocardia tengchongensis TaxID=2055889 RepID=UPI003D16207B
MPIEAIPRNFAWLSTFEPMHQVFLMVASNAIRTVTTAAGRIHALIRPRVASAASPPFEDMPKRYPSCSHEQGVRVYRMSHGSNITIVDCLINSDQHLHL